MFSDYINLGRLLIKTEHKNLINFFSYKFDHLSIIIFILVF